MRRIQRNILPLVTAAFVAVAVLGLARPASAQVGWRLIDGDMSTGTALPAAVALPSGRVLIMGGQDLTTAPLTTVHIYDAASNTWLPNVAPMTRPRVYASAVALQNGRVLIAGGIDSTATFTATAEVYDPATNTWTPTADMPRAFAAGAGVTLLDGRVLVVGGIDDDLNTTSNASALFDPASGTWTVGPSMLTSRYLFNATLLQDGRVLVSGGISVESTGVLRVADAELFDPLTNTWSPGGHMAEPTAFATAAVLPDGRVIVAGGSAMTDGNYPIVARVELYDPATNLWQPAPSMSRPRSWGAGGVTADGRFVMAAGITQDGVTVTLESSAEAYDPITNSWTMIDNLFSARFYVASAVVNGELLLAGGAATTDVGVLLTSGEVFTSVANNPPVAVASAPATVQGLAGAVVDVELSAVGSYDPDGNPLTFVWSEGSTTLATTVDPTRTALVGLGVGEHTLTLTVSDSRGGTSTASVVVTVVDVAAVLNAQIAQLASALQDAQAQNAQLTADLQQAQAQLAAAGLSVTNAVGAVQARMRSEFRNPSFEIPGGSPAAQLQAIVDAILGLNRGSLLQLYRPLTPAAPGGQGRGGGR